MSALRAVPDLSGLDREATVAALRRSMAGLGAAVPETSGGVDWGYGPGDVVGGERIPVPPGLAGLFDGGLPKGAVSVVDVAGAVVAGILAEVTAAGGHVAIVGVPDFSPLGIVEHGGDLSRVLEVPDPGESPLEVVGLLADGVEVVVVKLSRTPSPSMARPVMARLRGSGCALLYVGGDWPGAKVSVTSCVTAIHGLGAGHGRIRGVEFRVTARGAGRPGRSVRWAVGDCPAAEAPNVAPLPLRRAE